MLDLVFAKSQDPKQSIDGQTVNVSRPRRKAWDNMLPIVLLRRNPDSGRTGPFLATNRNFFTIEHALIVPFEETWTVFPQIRSASMPDNTSWTSVPPISKGLLSDFECCCVARGPSIGSSAQEHLGGLCNSLPSIPSFFARLGHPLLARSPPSETFASQP